MAPAQRDHLAVRALAKKTGTLTERVDLSEAIREVLALCAGEARKHAVGLRTQFPGDLSPVRGDRVLIQQVVLNLVMNGIEAMSDVQDRLRELVIQARTEADQVRVTVQDSGSGLDPQTLERCSIRCTPPNPGAWVWGCRSVARSSRITGGGCRSSRKTVLVQPLRSRSRRTARIVHADA